MALPSISKSDCQNPKALRFLAKLRKIHRAGTVNESSIKDVRDWLAKNSDLKLPAVATVREMIEQITSDNSSEDIISQLESAVTALVSQQDERFNSEIRRSMFIESSLSGFFGVIIGGMSCPFVLAGMKYFLEWRLAPMTVGLFFFASLLPGIAWGIVKYTALRKTYHRRSVRVTKTRLDLSYTSDDTRASHRHWTCIVTTSDGESVPVDQKTYDQIKAKLEGKQSKKRTKKQVELECGFSNFLSTQITWPPYCID